jgi:hypothetical protein
MTDDHEHDVGCDHHEEDAISSDRAKAGPGAVGRGSDLGSRARHGSKHNERESGIGDGVEEVEKLERPELLRGLR